MRKRILSYILMLATALILVAAVPAGVLADSGDTCMVPGCMVSVDEGGFTESEMIGGVEYYHISTAAQLAHISEHLDLNYIQTADIDLAQYNGGFWTPIGGFGEGSNDPDYFTGKYIGDGYRIENLQIDFDDPAQNSAYAGLFGYIDGADAKVSGLTVTVAGVEITAYNYALFGGITGYLYGGSVEDCHVIYEGDVVTSTTPNGAMGGITGYAYPQWDSSTGGFYPAAIDGCTVTFTTGSLRGASWSNYVGGIAGRSGTSIINCDVVIDNGEIIEGPLVGGIAGIMNAKDPGIDISGCTVTGEGSIVLSPQHYYVCYAGGIVGGLSESSIEDSLNTVQVDASGISKIGAGNQVYAGGIAGYIGSRSNLKGCANTGEVSVVIANHIVDYYDVPTISEGNEFAFAGGIAGYVNGYSNAVKIENCENNADISSVNLIPGLRAYAGGLIGHVDSGDGDYAGVQVLNCANLGADKEVYAAAGTTMAGGLFGSTSFHDFASPNIFLANSYNRASVAGVSNSPPTDSGRCVGITAGGIIGAAGEVSVANTYSTAADVSAVNNGNGADAYEGGLFGIIYMTTTTQNYYEINANVTKAVGGKAAGMDILAEEDLEGAYQGGTAAQLKTKSFYGDDWVWYTGGGTAPDYYNTMDPWRMTAADSYPVLKGLPYTPCLITATATEGGSITPSGDCNVNQNQDITFTITPNYGYVVADVLVDGVSVGAVTSYTFTNVTADHTIAASFLHNCPAKQFTDVDVSKWYHEGIDFVLLEGLFKGLSATVFAPNDTMTRAMLVTVLYRLAGEPATAAANPFHDVAANQWYTKAVIWAADKGIVKGYNATTFGTNGAVTREQTAVLLYRYAEYKGYDLSGGDDFELSKFSDGSAVSGYAITAMKWACGVGIIQGDNNKLRPGGKATRAEAATMLMRFVKNIKNMEE